MMHGQKNINLFRQMLVLTKILNFTQAC